MKEFEMVPTRDACASLTLPLLFGPLFLLGLFSIYNSFINLEGSYKMAALSIPKPYRIEPLEWRVEDGAHYWLGL